MSAKYIHAGPATGRTGRDIEATNERANQSVIEVDDIMKFKTGFGITFRVNDKLHYPLVVINKLKT